MRHTTLLATAFTALVTTSAFAAELPGKGITVKPAQSTISEETFQTLLVSRALEKLGYNVEKPSEEHGQASRSSAGLSGKQVGSADVK